MVQKIDPDKSGPKGVGGNAVVQKVKNNPFLSLSIVLALIVLAAFITK